MNADNFFVLNLCSSVFICGLMFFQGFLRLVRAFEIGEAAIMGFRNVG